MKAAHLRVSFSDLKKWPEDGRRYELYDGEVYVVLLFTRDRQHLVRPQIVTRYAPDLSVEILSPSTERNDRGRTMKLPAAHGVREYWLIDPESVTIEVYKLAGAGFELANTATTADDVQSPLLPDLSLSPRDHVPSE